MKWRKRNHDCQDLKDYQEKTNGFVNCNGLWSHLDEENSGNISFSRHLNHPTQRNPWPLTINKILIDLGKRDKYL